MSFFRRAQANGNRGPLRLSHESHEFQLRLINLYSKHECLWNMDVEGFNDVEAKRNAWQKIAADLGAQVTVPYLKQRINHLRHALDIFKLELLEYQMSAGKTKKPQKLYFMDHFDFLNQTTEKPKIKQEEEAHLKEILHEKTTKKHLDRKPQDIFKMQNEPASKQLPRLKDMVKQRLNNKFSRSIPFDSVGSFGSLVRRVSEIRRPVALIAQPGESISRTAVLNKILKSKQEAPPQSKTAVPPPTNPLGFDRLLATPDDEDLYRLHWDVRVNRQKKPFPTRQKKYKTKESN